MTHTPEPWRIREDVTGRPNWIAAENDTADIAELAGWPASNQAEEEANAARIVACVNGCTGLNPAAYREVVEALELALEWDAVDEKGFDSVWRNRAEIALAKARAV